MLAFIATVAVATTAGVAFGWWLRSVTSWCPQCGTGLRCATCGLRPGVRATLGGGTGTVRPRQGSRDTAGPGSKRVDD